MSFAFDLIPLGLEYIAASIQDAVDQVSIVDMELDQRSFQECLDFYSPDLVGISLSATEHNQTLRLAKAAKNYGATTVVGGYHPTSVPDLMLSYPQIDVVVRGEGEQTMRELVEQGTPQGVLGASYKQSGRIIHNKDRPRSENLDSIPFPARRLRQYPYKSADRTTDCDVLMMSRGCHGLCSFCCEPSMSDGCSRCRSPENVMKEILEMAKFHANKPVSVMFADPNFIGNPRQVERLCDLIMAHDLNIEFGALVRADMMANNPRIVRKMCQAGIVKFEMGIESPNAKDLASTKKGVATKFHKQAVKNIREYGGRAGGTFVIGLPDQTEDEIKTFPVYAKEIGLTATAFGIATPFPGTEFYSELDVQGLIFETNWDNFDEMHSVFKTNHLTKETIEELATYCMAKFWNLDTFIDHEFVSQKRTLRKKPIVDFVKERSLNLGFMSNNGNELQKDNFHQHVKTFLEAYVDPRVESYTRSVEVHEVLEISRVLRLLGPQKVQCTLNLDETAVSFVFKTTGKSVEYIQVAHGRVDDSTINLDVDLNWLLAPSTLNLLKTPAYLFQNNLSVKKLWSTFRLFVAVGSEFLVSVLPGK
ncbi:MAG: B12-binding domain-containing radical SAM protein [Candidatus Bathyarchaeota archaeon]|nr:B12-binding domain-containing radical SAM protein [Candidatus Bathyarchaeota archaeon]